jgi:hypothetical protein
MPMGHRDCREEHLMNETGDESNETEEALTDHHLDEVAEMIERAQAEKPSSDRPVTDHSPGYLRPS